LSLTVRKLSQLSRIQRDVVLALAQRIREASKRDTLTIILPRFKYLRNIANSLISILQIRHEAGTKEIKEIIGKIPEDVIGRFVNSEAVSLSKKTIDFEKLDGVIRANINDMSPQAASAAPRT